jgi:hypothetical protein
MKDNVHPRIVHLSNGEQQLQKDIELGVTKNLMTVLDHELDCIISGLHIRHLTLEAVVAHDSWGENNGKVLWGHLLKLADSSLLILE